MSRTALGVDVLARHQRVHALHDLTFLLESVLFLLTGLQRPHVIRGLSVGRPLGYAGWSWPR